MATQVTVGTSPVAESGAVPARQMQRKVLRLSPDTLERVDYWATRRQMSVDAYLREAVEEAIRRENLDYDLPTLEIARLNELVDRLTSLERTQQNLQAIVVSMVDTFTALTRGDGPNGPLGDADSGELYG